MTGPIRQDANPFAAMRPQALKVPEGKVMLHLLPPGPLCDIARVRQWAADTKYQPWDWTLSRNWTEYYDAMLRHMFAWQTGQNLDPESGLHHVAHACCNGLFLLEFFHSTKGVDNRPTGLLVDISGEKR